jgi:hypothetical protein
VDGGGGEGEGDLLLACLRGGGEVGEEELAIEEVGDDSGVTGGGV